MGCNQFDCCSLFWLTDSTQSLVWQVIHFTQLLTYSVCESFHLLTYRFIQSIVFSVFNMLNCLFPHSHFHLCSRLVGHLFTCPLICWVSVYTLTQVFPVSPSLKRKYSLSVDHMLTRSVNSFTDRFEKNAECPPLECWECDNRIPACFSSTIVLKD